MNRDALERCFRGGEKKTANVMIVQKDDVKQTPQGNVKEGEQKKKGLSKKNP